MSIPKPSFHPVGSHAKSGVVGSGRVGSGRVRLDNGNSDNRANSVQNVCSLITQMVLRVVESSQDHFHLLENVCLFLHLIHMAWNINFNMKQKLYKWETIKYMTSYIWALAQLFYIKTLIDIPTPQLKTHHPIYLDNCQIVLFQEDAKHLMAKEINHQQKCHPYFDPFLSFSKQKPCDDPDWP